MHSSPLEMDLVAVIGSMEPWFVGIRRYQTIILFKRVKVKILFYRCRYESIALARGAKNTLTIE